MNKSKSLLAVLVFISGAFLISSNAIAGRYDGIADAFNRVAKNIEPPPPKTLDYEYKAKDFDPPGSNGPTNGSSYNQTYTSPTYSNQPKSLTETFNGQ